MVNNQSSLVVFDYRVCTFSINNTVETSPNVDSYFSNLTYASRYLNSSVNSLKMNVYGSYSERVCPYVNGSLTDILTQVIQSYENVSVLLNYSLSSFQADIINNVLIDALPFTKNNMTQLLISLTSLFNELKYENNDLRVFINETLMQLNQLIPLFKSNLIYTTIPATLNFSSEAFSNLNNSIHITYLALSSLKSLISGSISPWNGKNLLIKSFYCVNFTLARIMMELSNINNIFTAYSQINAFISNFQSIFFQSFMYYRYELFLVNNYNVTNRFSDLNGLVNNCFSQFMCLNGPIENITLFNNASNITEFLDNIIKLESSINSSLTILFGTMNLSCSESSYMCFNINKTIEFLNLVTQFSQDNSKYLSSSIFSNSRITIPYLNTSSSYLSSYILNQSKYTIENLCHFTNEWVWSANMLQNNVSNPLSTYIQNYTNSFSQLALDVSFVLVYLAQDYINSTTYNSYMNLSNIFLFLSNYSSEMIPLFLNLTQFSNNNTYINEFQSNVHSFMTYIAGINLASFYSIDTNIKDKIKCILDELNTGLLKTDSFLSLLQSMLTTTSTTTTLTNSWNVWEQWSVCVFFRVRRNLVTNQLYRTSEKVSCSQIGICR